MNPKGVTTKGLWIKVFVKALPNTATSQINFCLQFSQQAKKIWAAIEAVHIFLSELSFYIYDIFF